MEAEVTYPNDSSEVMFSLGADSKEEVDQIAEVVSKNGGKVFSEPSYIDGWMYNCGFKYPDGHRWNSLFMDQLKMPK